MSIAPRIHGTQPSDLQKEEVLSHAQAERLDSVMARLRTSFNVHPPSLVGLHKPSGREMAEGAGQQVYFVFDPRTDARAAEHAEELAGGLQNMLVEIDRRASAGDKPPRPISADKRLEHIKDPFAYCKSGTQTVWVPTGPNASSRREVEEAGVVTLPPTQLAKLMDVSPNLFATKFREGVAMIHYGRGAELA